MAVGLAEDEEPDDAGEDVAALSVPGLGESVPRVSNLPAASPMPRAITTLTTRGVFTAGVNHACAGAFGLAESLNACR